MMKWKLPSRAWPYIHESSYPYLSRMAERSVTASAKSSIWNATSSIRQVVPGLRIPPTVGKIPARIDQYSPYSCGSVVKEKSPKVSNVFSTLEIWDTLSARSC